MFVVFNTMLVDVFDLDLYPPHYMLRLGPDLKMTEVQELQLREHIADQFNGLQVAVDPQMTLDDLYKKIIQEEWSQLLDEGVEA